MIRDKLCIVSWDGADVEMLQARYELSEYRNIYRAQDVLSLPMSKKPILSLFYLSAVPCLRLLDNGWLREHMVVIVTDNEEFIREKELYPEFLDIVSVDSINGHEVEMISYYQKLGKLVEKHRKTGGNGIVFDLINILNSCDSTTAIHDINAVRYVRILLEAAKEANYYTEPLSMTGLCQETEASLLHDIGKVLIPRGILLKPAPLTDSEFVLMREHVDYGGKILDYINNRVCDDGVMKLARNYCDFHHEWWNGNGYPEGLYGEHIPIQGRIMAIADVYDVMVSRRPYKDPVSHEEALEVIYSEAGTHFDPYLVEIFSTVVDKIRAVERRSFS